MINKILCIDDDPITLMLCKKVLLKVAFSKEIEFANNGANAIKFFDELKIKLNNNSEYSIPEIIFLDLNMPIMNGWDFLTLFSNEEYSSYFQSIKIIVLTSTVDPKDLEKSKKYPMITHFLSKPITTEMLTGLL